MVVCIVSHKVLNNHLERLLEDLIFATIAYFLPEIRDFEILREGVVL